MGRWSVVKCPICKKAFEDCPHSIAQKVDREDKDKRQAEIRDVVLRMKKRGEI